MTLQLPLFRAASAAAQRQTAQQATAAMGMAAHNLPPHAAVPFSQQDLMAWIMSGGATKLGSDPAAAATGGVSHLHLDAQSLADELNAPSRCSGAAEEHVVPQAPASPDSTLASGWGSPAVALPADAEAGAFAAPATPELTAGGKRKWEDVEHMPTQPRTHRRKSLHPMRAAEAVADDWESRASPSRASTPPAPARKHARHSPERIHRKVPAPKAARQATTSAAASGSNMVKECHDCHTLKTPMWRRVEGMTFCNACGLRRTRALVGR